MFDEAVQETEGIAGIRRLQLRENKIWAVKEVEALPSEYFPRKNKEICYFIGGENSRGRIPSTEQIQKKSGLSMDCIHHFLLKRDMGFSVTIPEFLKFIQQEGLLSYGYKGITLPKHFDWLYPYLKKYRPGLERSSMSWTKKIRTGRVNQHELHFVAQLRMGDGMPCYHPLGLHLLRHEDEYF
jgi:hypothetical protein